MDGLIGIVVGVIVVCLWMGRLIRLVKAKSGNIEERREALYELGCDAWNWSNNQNCSNRAYNKDKAIEYWIQAADLGHEGAQDKLRMVQIRHGG